MDKFLYAVEDEETGKLVSDITNPKRRYWDKRGNAVNAIQHHMHSRKRKYKKLNLVTFKLEPFSTEEVDY